MGADQTLLKFGVCGAVTLTVLTLGSVARADEVSERAVRHAEALLWEADGKIEQALDALRTLIRADPSDREVAFDLARIASQRPDLARPDDVDPFLAAEPTNVDEAMLASSLLRANGDPEGAEALLERFAQAPNTTVARPDAIAATGSTRDPGAGPKRWSARVRSGVGYDSNVTLISSNTATAPASTGVDSGVVSLHGSLDTSLLRAMVDWRLGIWFDYTVHLASGEFARPFDLGTFGLSTRVAKGYGSGEFYVQALISGTINNNSFVNSEDQLSLFLFDGTGVAGLIHSLADHLDGGLYVSVSGRDFGGSGSIQNIERTAEQPNLDRDGARVDVVTHVDFGSQSVGASVQGGVYSEFVDSPAIGALGPRAALRAYWAFAMFVAEASMLYDYRVYGTARGNEDQSRRLDHYLNPAISLAFEPVADIAVVGTYEFAYNESNNVNFGFERHRAYLEVELRWN